MTKNLNKKFLKPPLSIPSKEKLHINVITVGHVNHGKTTLTDTFYVTLAFYNSHYASQKFEKCEPLTE